MTAAATRQLRKLNTNSRFVYPQIAGYVQKLVATLSDPLDVVFLVCTGSEANDLALRIARQVTGRQHSSSRTATAAPTATTTRTQAPSTRATPRLSSSGSRPTAGPRPPSSPSP
ncbi:hypothetical protein PYR72_41425 [Streptomyces sp. VNUA24]|nr:hypothetical protein [Streptomyces sp. VNUA24]WEH20465.1 hypothetical protein PYR72_41425 [Streptomyces sp. VNUA24]